MNIAELRNKIAYMEKGAREAYVQQHQNSVKAHEASSYMNGYYTGKAETYDLMALRLGNLLEWIDREMYKDATHKE